MKNFSRAAWALLAALACLPASAAIEQTAKCKGAACRAWPKMAATKGWHADASMRPYGMNAFVPDGATFRDADVVIYSRAMPHAAAKTLDALIARDKADIARNGHGLTVNDAKALENGDGDKLKSFTSFPTVKGNWERMSYDEEAGYYLTFTLSARTQAAYDKALPAYVAMVQAYREKG